MPLLVGVLGLALALTGCAGGNSSATDDAPTSPATTDDRFPVTIEAAYGEITVEQAPERIVSLNGNYVDLLDLLGEDTIAFANSTQTEDEYLASAPWMEGRLQHPPDPNLITAGSTANVEAIAALEPDLILGNIWNIDEQTYEQLSQIAPTYAGVDPVSQTGWEDHLTSLATLTGNDSALVEEISTGLDTDFATARERIPGLQGSTFMVAATDSDAVFWLTEYGNDAVERLGLVPDALQPTTGAEGQVANYSWERLDEFTADVVFFVTEHRDPSGETQARLEADPRLPGLPAADNGTLVFFSPSTTWSAINGGTPTSYRWWIEQVLPQLEDSALNRAGR